MKSFHIYFIGFMRNKTHTDEIFNDCIKATKNNVKFYYYMPNRNYEFDESYETIPNINSMVKLESFDYDINKYINMTINNNLLIKNTKKLYNYRMLSYFDQLLHVIGMIESNKDTINIITRWDKFDKVNICYELLDDHFDEKCMYIKRGGSKLSDWVEDRTFILNKYGTDIFKKIKFKDIIHLCKQLCIWPEIILRDILNLHDYNIKSANHFSEFNGWGTYTIKYSDDYTVKIQKLYDNIMPNYKPMYKIAILLIGLERSWDKYRSQWLNILRLLNADLFVCTAKNNYMEIYYYYMKYNQDKQNNFEPYVKGFKIVDEIEGGRVHNQYWKYKKCYEIMEKYEFEHNIKYDVVMKIRGDVHVKNITNNFIHIKPYHLYMNTDHMFYGYHDEMKIPCNLFDGYNNYYSKRPWNKRIILFDKLLSSLNNTKETSWNRDTWKHRNKISTIPIPIVERLWDNNKILNIAKKKPVGNYITKKHMIDVCNHYLNMSIKKLDPIIDNTCMTSRTRNDRCNTFRCEYFIIDWCIIHNITVCDTEYFVVDDIH